MFAESWRSRVRALLGEGAYKGLYTLASVAGLVLIVWGYGLALSSSIEWMSRRFPRIFAACSTGALSM